MQVSVWWIVSILSFSSSVCSSLHCSENNQTCLFQLMHTCCNFSSDFFPASLNWIFLHVLLCRTRSRLILTEAFPFLIYNWYIEISNHMVTGGGGIVTVSTDSRNLMMSHQIRTEILSLYFAVVLNRNLYLQQNQGEIWWKTMWAHNSSPKLPLNQTEFSFFWIYSLWHCVHISRSITEGQLLSLLLPAVTDATVLPSSFFQLQYVMFLLCIY